MKKLLILLLLSVFLLSGCECIGGLGRDVQKAGQWMQDQAK